ncbi:MAG: HIT family protein [Planctomycetes bacterium]|nr:HIT family protein [Planctomycetota bacterium]
MPSIFTRIIAGEIPCHRVYEDEHVIAFLDIGPLSRGHVLVVPKEERERLHELSEESAAALGIALRRVAAALVRATGCADYNVLQNNGAAAHQAVMHVHFHVIPRHADGTGLGIQWEPRTLQADAAMLAQSIAREMPTR